MYNQGNFPFGQRLPPPPPPPFQQGPAAPQHPIGHQGSSSVPPAVGQPGPPAYGHASSAPPAPNPPGGMLNSGQSYLFRPPQMLGSTPMPSYSTSQQNFQWPQSGHHIQPHIPPPLVHHPYPRMLPPPPPPQGQAFYRGSVHPPPPPPPPQGGVANFQHGPLPPPPPPPPSNSQFFMSSPGVSFTQSAHESATSLLPPPPPPPPPPPASPPPMPPPLPPSSPPHTSPIPSSAPIFATASDPSMSSTKPSDFELMASDVVGRASDPHPSNDDGLKYNSDGFTESKVSSPPKQCVLSDGSLKPDLPLPPPRPAEEVIARKIEVLCHYIGKNGDKFEAMTRQKEFGNPEFKFLFGGEPGSEAAVAHEYFLWMKKKCSLECELHDDSYLRPSVSDSSFQLDGVTDAVVSHSSVDSDMDMEDDITQPDEAQVICKSVGSANQGSVLNSNELDMTQSPHANYAEHTSGEDVTCTNLISTGSLGVVEQGENDCDYFKNLSAKGGESVVECTSNSDSERFNSSPHENLKKSSPLAAAGGSSVKVTSELRKGASPFRLLQDYASDDSSENVDDLCVEDFSRATASLSTGAGARSSDGYPTNLGFKDFPELNKEVGPASVSVTTSSLGILSQSPEPSTEVEGVERKIDKSVGSEMAEQLEDSYGRYEVLDAGTSHKASQEKDHLGHGDVDASGSAKLRKEEMRSNSNQLEVDEFGRLHRAGASDSDSDELHYKRRRGKRDRSRSRSRSPHDRRRRSPLRRREKLSRSPRNRRSRSRSPSYRRGGEAGVDRSRRERGQLPDCFDFLRGKCFRGTSCRYFHDSDKAEESRQHKSKQYYQDFSRSLKSSGKSVHQHDETNRQEMHYQDFPGSAADAMKDADVKQDAILVGKGASDRRLPSEKGSVSLVTNVAGHEIAQRLTSQEQETGDTQEGPVEPANNLAETATSLENNFLFTDSDGKKLVSDISERTSSFGHLTDQLSQASPFIPVLQTYDYQSLQTKDSSTSVPAASTFPSQLLVNEPQDSQQTSLVQSDPDAGPLSNTHLAEYMTSQELRPNIPAHLPHPQPPVPPVSQGPNPPIPPQLFSDYNNMPSAAKYPSHSASGENFIPYQTSMAYQHSHFSIPPASSWSFLPPPPPHPPHGVSSSQFPQNQLLPRNDHSSSSFPRPYATDMPTHSQVGEFHHGRHPVQEHDRRLSQTEDLRPRTFPIDYSMTQQFGGSSLTGEDTTRPPVQGLIPSNPFAHGNIHPRPVFSRESPTRRMQSLPGDILPPGELPTPSSEGHRHFPPYSLQGPAADNFSVTRGESGNIHSGYSSEFLDKNLPSHLSDFGRSRITNHYNPYASTFDQPLSTKFSSNIPTQENDASYSNKYSGRSNLSHAPADGQGVSTLSSRIMTSSPNSARDVAETLPRPGGDQYDPIFDSFEPSSSSLRRNDNVIKREATDNIDIMLRFNPSNKPQDPAENNMQKEAGAVAVSISAENDEFGETADGEVGAVENGSPSDPADSEDLATGDIEIEQVKTPGKIKKKSKDSRSMKLFKVALADFVKEVLKPSWRQGNMSKEAFKTIVKKTVEKVSGAMKSHHIPKSQAKINHYIDSSQRKLTKLVMGYVDKYVKS